MKHSNGFEVAENAKPKEPEPYIEKNRALFFYMVPNRIEIVAHAIYIYISEIWFRKSGLLVIWLVVITLFRISFRNPRNYAVTAGMAAVRN